MKKEIEDNNPATIIDDETESKWTIADETLKEAFSKLGIDDKYYPIFSKKAIRYLNEISEARDRMQDRIDFSLDLATNFMKMINCGLSDLWVYTYTEFKTRYWFDDEGCALEAYNLISEIQGKDKADEELKLYAGFLESPSVELYVFLFKKYVLVDETPEYLRLYNSLIEKGKSAVYAKQYTLGHLSGFDDDFCDRYASKYETCISNEMYYDIVFTLQETCYEQCRLRHGERHNEVS